MLPEMLEPAACVKNHTATFLILDITDRLSKHTHTVCFQKLRGCNIQIFNRASPLRSHSSVFFPPVNEADVGGILNPTDVVTLNLKGCVLSDSHSKYYRACLFVMRTFPDSLSSRGRQTR